MQPQISRNKGERMNREIKFRVYISKYKILDTPDIINFNTQEVKYDSDYYSLDDIELMQYTGIKDKNGVEIYEGDIVLIRIDKTNILHKTVVKFKHGAFIADIIDNNDYIYLFHFGFNEDDFEVIGNIYENKNLLEE